MRKKLVKINLLIILLALSIIFPVFAVSAKKKVWYLNPIYINESIDDLKWADWANQPWCKGSGTEEDPYMIKNVVINGEGSPFCMVIANSDAHFKIQHCTFFNAKTTPDDRVAGLVLLVTTNGFVFKNQFLQNGWVGMGQGSGIALIGSQNNVIQKNLCSENEGPGIYLEWSDVNIIKQNDCTNNFGSGIVVVSSHKNIITKNDCNENNEAGISLVNFYEPKDTPKDNIIHANTVERNFMGVYLSDADINDVFRNNIAENMYGILVDSGCENNNIYHNNIIDNSIQGWDNEYGMNSWVNPFMLEGNYWSDYTGEDLDEDGIGDTPWPWLGFDSYPFMEKKGWDIFTAEEEEILNAFFDPESNRLAGGNNNPVQSSETSYLIFGLKQLFSERIQGLFSPPYTTQFLFFGTHEMQGSLWYFDEIFYGEPGYIQFFYIVFPPNFFTDKGLPLGLWYEFFIQFSFHNDGVPQYMTTGPYYFLLV